MESGGTLGERPTIPRIFWNNQSLLYFWMFCFLNICFGSILQVRQEQLRSQRVNITAQWYWTESGSIRAAGLFQNCNCGTIDLSLPPCLLKLSSAERKPKAEQPYQNFGSIAMKKAQNRKLWPNRRLSLPTCLLTSPIRFSTLLLCSIGTVVLRHISTMGKCWTNF